MSTSAHLKGLALVFFLLIPFLALAYTTPPATSANATLSGGYTTPPATSANATLGGGAAPSSSCVYAGSGNWNVNCSENCLISNDYDLLGSNFTASGSGQVNMTGNATNYTDFIVSGGCTLLCMNGGGPK